MLNSNTPWGILFGGNEYIIFHLIPETQREYGGVVCSGVVDTGDDCTPLVSLLVYMHLLASDPTFGTHTTATIADVQARVPIVTLGGTRSSTLAKSVLSPGQTFGQLQV